MTDITIIGTGYVGLVAAVGLADFGNRVVGADIDAGKIAKLKEGIPPIYEPGIEDYLKRNIDSGRLTFTSDVEVAVRGADVVFLAVGTPPKEDGSADLSFLEAAADTIAENAKGYTVVVIKSTVPVGTNRALQERIEKKNPDADVDVVSNPEFLREGRAVQDFFHPDRTVVGTESERAREAIRTIYRALNLISVPFVWCNRETAELIKYASNAFLATKITFINQMANLADAVGADIHAVAKTMGMDGRISPKFLHPGPGYGGSCFPKDTKAVASTGDDVGVDMSLIKSVIEANERQKKRVVSVLAEMLGGLEGRTVAVLGLAFKSETDDVRDSPSLAVVPELLESGAAVRAHDPQGMDNFKAAVPETECFGSSYEALEGADALVLMTEWNEYRSLDLRIAAEKMSGRVILDARNLLDPDIVREAGFEYRGTGRGA
jgi:UDPglucose 6-dehydrogenase